MLHVGLTVVKRRIAAFNLQQAADSDKLVKLKIVLPKYKVIPRELD